MSTESVPGSPRVLDFDRDDDDLIDIFFDKPKGGPGHGGHKGHRKGFYDEVVDKSSNSYSYTPVAAADSLHRLYPKHSIVMTEQGGILTLPGVAMEPLDKNALSLITNVWFAPIPRRSGGVPGVLVDTVEYGGLKLNWNGLDFLLFSVTYPIGFSTKQQHFLLHEGPEDPSRLLLLSVGAWREQLHDEIWVYDQGWWQKSHALWTEVQKANWDDVILDDKFKKALQKDVYGFFSSEAVYKDLGIAWKRGLIMYGPPGNGKTISLKAIMKTCGEKGFHPLYVKSFKSWAGEEAAMADVFNKARQLSPCVIILEDLDSLINDQNRSFFLNQVDGIEGNDGLLLIGTTNHFDRLDPGLSTRPSRFDRKYQFDDPNLEDRVLYVQYWQKKLKNNSEVDFPDSLVREIAEITERFSFAYLKEAFVSTLVTLAGLEGDKPSFASLIKSEIEVLRKQLDKALGYNYTQQKVEVPQPIAPARPPRPTSSNESDIRSLLDALSESSPLVDSPARRIFTDIDRAPRPSEEEIRKNRNIHALLDALADHMETSDVASFRRFESPPPRRHGPQDDEIDYRSLLDRLSERERDMRLFDLQQHSRQRSRRGHNHHSRHDHHREHREQAQGWEGYRALHHPRNHGPEIPTSSTSTNATDLA